MKYYKRIPKYPPYLCNSTPLAGITAVFSAIHTGVDSVSILGGMDVCAVCAGTVTNVYWSDTHGNCVEYGAGDVIVRYCHLGKTYVKAGQAVTPGTKIGQMGSTGILANGLHLHTSILIGGNLVDPMPYLDGSKALPIPAEAEKNKNDGGNYMIRKVTSPLNLRESASLSAARVYKDMPKDTVFLVTETKQAGGITWGHVVVTINGTTYTGWSNIASTWSVEA